MEGLRDLTKSLRRISKDLPKEVREINLRLAEPVAELAKRKAPKKSGKLAGSIRPLATQRGGRVVVGRKSIVYVNPIYWGWARHNIEPHPFIDDAIEQQRAKTEAQFIKEVDSFIREVWSQW